MGQQKSREDSTATGAAFMKALETNAYTEESRVCNDKLAPTMLDGCITGCLLQCFPGTLVKVIDRKFPNLTMHFAARTRYLDDCVIAAIDDGLKTVVILGAGYDTRAYRLKSASYFEIDRPAVQQLKQERLRAANLSGATLIPVDFQKDSLAEKLQTGGVCKDDATIFLWEGVTQYISREAIVETLTVLTKFRKMRLVFTYVDSRIFGDDASVVEDSFDIKVIMKEAAKKGEPWITGFAADEIPDFLRSFGLQVVEDIGFDDFNARYYQPVGRKIESGLRCERFVLAEN